MVKPALRPLLLALGWLCLVLGFVGIFLPILPTTPFVLLAAYCFSQSSARLHQWLLSTRLFGQLIRDWEKHGVIRLRAKITATTLMVGLLAYTIGLVPVSALIKAVVGLTTGAVLAFVWSRPSHPC